MSLPWSRRVILLALLLHQTGQALSLAPISWHGGRALSTTVQPRHVSPTLLAKKKGRPSIGERLDELLDRPFFDPEERGEDEPGLLRRFRAAFDSDPESASTLFVGLYFAVSDIAPLNPLLCVTLVTPPSRALSRIQTLTPLALAPGASRVCAAGRAALEALLRDARQPLPVGRRPAGR